MRLDDHMSEKLYKLFIREMDTLLRYFKLYSGTKPTENIMLCFSTLHRKTKTLSINSKIFLKDYQHFIFLN